VIDEDFKRKQDVLNVTYEDRKRINNESIINRRIFRRFRNKIMRKIHQKLHDIIMHKLSLIQSRDKILSNAHYV
jgi:hypothetical protein